MSSSCAELLVAVMLLAGCGTGGREGAGSAPHARGPDLRPAHRVGPKVALVVNDKQVDLGVDEVAHGAARVTLRDLWNAGMPTEDPMLLHFDLYDAHGFHPATSPACKQLLNGSDFAAGTMDVATHDVDFAESLNDCYRLHAVVRIVGVR